MILNIASHHFLFPKTDILNILSWILYFLLILREKNNLLLSFYNYWDDLLLYYYCYYYHMLTGLYMTKNISTEYIILNNIWLDKEYFFLRMILLDKVF